MKMILSKSPVLFACSSLCVSGLLVSCGEKPAEEPKQVAPTEEPVSEAAQPEVEPEIPAPEAAPKEVEPEVEPVVEAPEVGVVHEKEMTPQELKASFDHPWELTDMTQIRTRAGEDAPKVGDTIYAMKNVPTNKCGEYWVMDPDGYVNKLAVCHGDPNDPNHTH